MKTNITYHISVSATGQFIFVHRSDSHETVEAKTISELAEAIGFEEIMADCANTNIYASPERGAQPWIWHLLNGSRERFSLLMKSNLEEVLRKKVREARAQQDSAQEQLDKLREVAVF